MTKRRVVITGIGVVSALGEDRKSLFEGIRAGRSAVQVIDQLREIEGVKTLLGAPLTEAVDLSPFPPKLLRSTGRVAHFALAATARGLEDAEFSLEQIRGDDEVGVAFGSGIGGWNGMQECARFIHNRSTRGISASVYHKMMAHTCAMHLSLHFGITGRLLCTSTACTSGSQSIGFGYEHVAEGKQEVMVCGGAEELSDGIISMFDILCACSLQNGSPDTTPRPFDRKRDGMVVGEGACTLVMESLDHAKARGAPILAEIVGFATNSDAHHITNPDSESVARCFRKALAQADISPGAIDYVNAHGTGTSLGDAAEAKASLAVYGETPYLSSLKGHLGHTLGACGALEAAATIEMMRHAVVVPTRNLDEPECVGPNYAVGEPINTEVRFAATNTVAFGGVNTSIILKRWDQ